MSIYFDNSATTRTCVEAIQASTRAMDTEFYNPSSLYGPAVNVSRQIQGCRESMAGLMSCRPEEVYFTSGGTESNNTAVFGAVGRDKRHCLVSAVEHSSVFEAFSELAERGMNVDILGVDRDGRVTEEELKAKMRPYTALVSIMHVNNEIGSINDINALAATARRINPKVFFHSDGVQAFLKVSPPNVAAIDAYSISSHKFHGPRGVGALYVRRSSKCRPMMFGGGQESKMRPGTENFPGIIGMRVAAERLSADKSANIQRMFEVKERLYGNLMSIDGARINGPTIEAGAPHILSIGFAGVNAETLVNALSSIGIYVGKGSACSSKNTKISRVLAAINAPETYAKGTLRFSFCAANTVEEADICSQAISDAANKLRRFSRR